MLIRFKVFILFKFKVNIKLVVASSTAGSATGRPQRDVQQVVSVNLGVTYIVKQANTRTKLRRERAKHVLGILIAIGQGNQLLSHVQIVPLVLRGLSALLIVKLNNVEADINVIGGQDGAFNRNDVQQALYAKL